MDAFLQGVFGQQKESFSLFLSLSFPFFLLETMKSNEEKCMAGQYKRGDVLLVLAMCQYAMGG